MKIAKKQKKTTNGFDRYPWKRFTVPAKEIYHFSHQLISQKLFSIFFFQDSESLRTLKEKGKRDRKNI